jgi:hypothetical protein
MLKKIFIVITALLAIIFIALCQIVIFDSGNGLLSKINCPLLCLSFILMFGSFKKAWWWAFGFGLILELFSFQPFGAVFLSFLVVIILGNWLLQHFLTNRSLYSFLVLIFFLFIVYNLFFNIILSIISSHQIEGFFAFFGSFWLNLFFQLLINGFLAVFLFLVFSSRQRRRSSFLSTK